MSIRIIPTCVVLTLASLAGLTGNGHAQTPVSPRIPEPVVLYVNSASTASSPSGASWPDAFGDLQDALNAAMSLTRPVEIWVAAGTYIPSEPVDPNYPRSASFALIDGVALYGGFPRLGTIAPALASWVHRDPDTHRTILSGDLGTSGVATDNCYHVLHADGVGERAVLDGFVITDGYADGPGQFEDGAGLYAIDASPTITRCQFIRNEAGDGGGFFSEGSGQPLLEQCEFIRNVANDDGGGAFDNSDNGVTFYDCRFESNVAAGRGGAIGALMCSPTVLWSTFVGNSADSGGAIRVAYGDPFIGHCEFRGNAATRGGAIYNGTSSSMSISNCAFFENDATRYGGAIHNQDASAIITNCSLVANSAADRAGGLMNVLTDSVEVANCIIWQNTDANTYGSTSQINDYSGLAAVVSYSCVDGGWSGTGNISAPPLFVNVSVGNLHLAPWSPCIDAGNNAAVDVDVDLGGRTRIAGTGPTVDMGCFERQ